VTPAARAGPGPDVPRPELARRFEGVLVWSDSATLARRTARSLVTLAEAGMAVAYVAPGAVEDLAGRLGPLPGRAVPVLVADSGGSGRAELTGAALTTLHRATDDQDAAVLARVGVALVEELRDAGLQVRLASADGAVGRAVVELVPSSPAPARTTRKRLLHDHGIGGVGGLADVAAEVARAQGMADARVTVSGWRIAVTGIDTGDVALDAATELWRRGIAPRDLLVLVDGATWLPHRGVPVVVPDVREATFALVGSRDTRDRPGIVPVPGGADGLRRVLAHQLRLRRRRTVPRFDGPPGWTVEAGASGTRAAPDQDVLFALADGRVGSGGPPLAGDRGDEGWTVAASVYDGTGPTTHLLAGPVVFALGRSRRAAPVARLLDLRSGLVHERSGSGSSAVTSVRFLALDRPTMAVVRAEVPAGHRTGPPVRAAGHAAGVEAGRLAGTQWMRVAGTSGGIVAAGVQSRTSHPEAAGGARPARAAVDRVVAVRTGADVLPPVEAAAAAGAEAAGVGFDRLLASHRRAWADRWEHADVVIEGDERLQAAVRFALFHLMGSVGDTDEAAVGPRGLTGSGYRGHVFWDADAFVLPFLAATHPASARAMLEYRLRRLPAALASARTVGRTGARFPWESARTGEDVTPPSARDRTGRLVPIRTGQLEEHIVAQVALAADTYVEWTGDQAFASGPLRTLLAATARYWASRIRVDADGTGHIFGVIGPDEYHEPVDDNAFTNVLARWNLRRAAELLDADPDGVAPEERARWSELAAGLYDGYDGDTGIYEQFAGFHRLEPLIIAEAAPRRPIAADLLLGPERTHGAQVVKQADVLMLHHLVPDEVVPGSLEPNLRYYEPRTAHGSSLSPAIFASLQARARDFGPALESLHTAAFLDLEDLTGSSSGGLHLATMGGLWQALAFGFAGLRARAGNLHVDPVLPPAWSGLELRVRFRGSAVHLRKERARLHLTVDRGTALVVGRTRHVLGPGTFQFRRAGPEWELMP
jgi:hypothetical protein